MHVVKSSRGRVLGYLNPRDSRLMEFVARDNPAFLRNHYVA